mmetsp:Transcript_8489/g.53044  ORF Transcript_8489/g.53044 Transcript_8489/m.53044 type:complete len:273 (-) Transcript_8489:982-1800(-)
MRLVRASLLLVVALLDVLLVPASCAYDDQGYSKLQELFGGIEFKHWLHEGLRSSEVAKPTSASPDGNSHGPAYRRMNAVKRLVLKWKNLGMKDAFATVEAMPADHRKIGRWDSQQYVKAAASSQRRGKKPELSPDSPKKRMLILPPDEFPPNEVVAGRGSLGPAFPGRNEFPSGTIGDNVEFPEHEEDSGNSPPVENPPASEDSPPAEGHPPIEQPPPVADPPPVEDSLTAEGTVEPALPEAEDPQLAPAPIDLSEDWEVLSYQGMAQYLGG